MCRFIPEMADALYFGHPGNRGDAVSWGEQLGAEFTHLGAYRGYGSVAAFCTILINWAVIMQGGVQVNAQGRCLCDEAHGYFEQAAEELRQPGGVAFDVFDAPTAEVARQFEDFRRAERIGAILRGDTVVDRAAAMHVPATAFITERDKVEKQKAANGMIASASSLHRSSVACRLFTQFKSRARCFISRAGGRSMRTPAAIAGTAASFPICLLPAERRPGCPAHKRRVICRATIC